MSVARSFGASTGAGSVFAKPSAVRWCLSFVLVAGMHAGAGAGALLWNPAPMLSAGEPAAAILIELAPLAAPEAVQELPPGPEQAESRPPEPPPRPEPEIEEPLPELPELEHADALLPPKLERPEPESEPEPEPIVEPEAKEPDPAPESPAQMTSAPPVIDAPPAPEAAAPTEGAPSRVPSTATATWQSALLGHLNRHKRYPLEARRRRDEGVVYVRFTMDRDGRVLTRELEESGGSRVLDAEAVELLTRADPLPAPPVEVAGEEIEIVVPVEFFIN